MTPRARIAHRPKIAISPNLQKTAERLRELFCSTKAKPLSRKQPTSANITIPNLPTKAEQKTIFYKPNFKRNFEVTHQDFPNNIQTLIIGLRAINDFDRPKKKTIRPYNGHAKEATHAARPYGGQPKRR